MLGGYHRGTLVSAKTYNYHKGWSGGAKVLGKVPVPGHPTNWDDNMARA